MWSGWLTLPMRLDLDLSEILDPIMKRLMEVRMIHCISKDFFLETAMMHPLSPTRCWIFDHRSGYQSPPRFRHTNHMWPLAEFDDSMLWRHKVVEPCLTLSIPTTLSEIGTLVLVRWSASLRLYIYAILRLGDCRVGLWPGPGPILAPGQTRWCLKCAQGQHCMLRKALPNLHISGKWVLRHKV